MSEKCGCVGIRLVYGLFYTAATPDWSHKLAERRENWATNGTVEGHSVRSHLLTKSSCCLKLRWKLSYVLLQQNTIFLLQFLKEEKSTLSKFSDAPFLAKANQVLVLGWRCCWFKVGSTCEPFKHHAYPWI